MFRRPVAYFVHRSSWFLAVLPLLSTRSGKKRFNRSRDTLLNYYQVLSAGHFTSTVLRNVQKLIPNVRLWRINTFRPSLLSTSNLWPYYHTLLANIMIKLQFRDYFAKFKLIRREISRSFCSKLTSNIENLLWLIRCVWLLWLKMLANPTPRRIKQWVTTEPNKNNKVKRHRNFNGVTNLNSYLKDLGAPLKLHTYQIRGNPSK